MTTIERSIELHAPASTAYRVWTRSDLFPEFMKGVESVCQTDERHLHCEGRGTEVPARPDAGQRARRTPEPRR